MKSLNLAQPTVMFIVGIPGAGKSFFANRFSETFGAPIISYDRIRYELFSEPRFTGEEFDLISRLAEYQMGELFKSKRSFIIDGGDNIKADRQRHTEQAKRAGYDVLIIWVQTHESTARTRSLKRSKRREDDKYNVALMADQFLELSKHFSAPTRESYMVISGMHTYSTQAKSVLRKLVVQREADAETAHRNETEALHQSGRKDNISRRSLIFR